MPSGYAGCGGATVGGGTCGIPGTWPGAVNVSFECGRSRVPEREPEQPQRPRPASDPGL